MVLYLDSSALVKIFVREPYDQLVRDLLEQASVVATSRVSYAEACSAMARARREGRLTESSFGAALEQLKAEWPDLTAIEVDEIAAGSLAVKHVLRGFDAVHLAAAMVLRAGVGGEPVTLTTFDTRQGQAARAEGFEVLPEARPLKSRSPRGRPTRRPPRSRRRGTRAPSGA